MAEHLLLVDMAQGDVVEGGVNHIALKEHVVVPHYHAALRAGPGIGKGNMSGENGRQTLIQRRNLQGEAVGNDSL